MKAFIVWFVGFMFIWFAFSILGLGLDPYTWNDGLRGGFVFLGSIFTVTISLFYFIMKLAP